MKNQFFKKLIFLVIISHFISSNANAQSVDPSHSSNIFQKSSYVFIGTIERLSQNISSTNPTNTFLISIQHEIFGKFSSNQISFTFAGGLLPSGRYVHPSKVPIFHMNGQYLFFIREGEWNISPIVDDEVYQVVNINNEEYFVNSIGGCIFDIDSKHGILAGPVVVNELFVGKIKIRRIQELDGSTIDSNLSHCMTKDEVIDVLSGIFEDDDFTPSFFNYPLLPLDEILIAREAEDPEPIPEPSPISDEENDNPMPIDLPIEEEIE